MTMNPTKTRSDELVSLGRRLVSSADAAAPSVDSGFDVTEWDQVLVAFSGDAVGVAEIQVYYQYDNFIGSAEGPAMVPGTYLRAVPLKDHTSTYRGNSIFILNTMKSDRLFASVISFAGASNVYINVFGLTRKGEQYYDVGSGNNGEDDADVFDIVDVIKVGGQTLTAHGAAATTIPLPVGARATAADPTAVDANDVTLLSTTLTSRLRVDAIGNVADDSAASGNPVRVAGTADAALSAVTDGDVAQLVTDLYRRLYTIPEGAAADDAAATTLNPLKVGAVADAAVAAVSDADMVHLTTDLYRRLRVDAEGDAAHGAAASGNPVLTGAKANAADPTAVDENDVANLSSTLEGRLRVQAAGVVAHDAAASGNPVLAGGKATTNEVTVDTNDAANLSLTTASRLRVDSDVSKVGGTATVTGGVAGAFGVGGIVAHGVASTSNPVLVGAFATVADASAVDANDVANLSATLTGRLRVDAVGNVADDAAASGNPVRIAGTADASLAAVSDGDVAQLVTDLYRRLYTIPEGAAADDAAATALNPVKVGAVADAAVAAVSDADMVHLVTDLYRRLRVFAEGATADDAASTTENPVKVGAIADQVLAAVSDADMVHLTTDLYRQLRTVSASYDSVAAADRVSANTHADDRDEAAQTWGSITDDATDPDYFPSSSGYEVGNRTWLTFHLRIRDGAVSFWGSNDGTNFEDITTQAIDLNTGAGGYASFSEPDSATVDYLLELVTGARYVYAKWDPANATSVFNLYTMARVP